MFKALGIRPRGSGCRGRAWQDEDLAQLIGKGLEIGAFATAGSFPSANEVFDLQSLSTQARVNRPEHGPGDPYRKNVVLSDTANDLRRKKPTTHPDIKHFEDDVSDDGQTLPLEKIVLNQDNMAERVGFEPTDPVKGQRFSRPPRSTTPAPLRTWVVFVAAS